MADFSSHFLGATFLPPHGAPVVLYMRVTVSFPRLLPSVAGDVDVLINEVAPNCNRIVACTGVALLRGVAQAVGRRA